MSACYVIRGGIIGVTAVMAPGIALGIVGLSAYAQNMWRLWGMLGVALLLVGGLAWTCVRVAHFPPGLAVFLSTISFDVLLLMAVPVRDDANGSAFFLYLVPFAVAMLIAWWAACRLARRSNSPPRGPDRLDPGNFDRP